MTAVIKNWVCWVSSVLFLGLLGPLEVSALQCEPPYWTPEQSDEMGVTVCEKGEMVGPYLSRETQSYPTDGQFSATKPFQIRSCGKYNCDRATSFNVLSEGVTLVDNHYYPNSKIPLTVSIKQKINGTTVTFSPDDPANTPCSSECDFQGAGRYREHVCEDCLDFELTLSADLNKLLEQGTLKQSGSHYGTLKFTIDQASSSVGGNGDSGVDRDVYLYITLYIPPLIQISGLENMTLSSEGIGTQQFCVYTFGAPTFSLMPYSANGESPGTGGPWSDFRLSNRVGDKLQYLMNIKTIKGGNKSHNFRWGSRQDYRQGNYTNWPPSNVLNCSNGENIELTITVIDSIDAAPAGVYSDTMTITVYPN